MRTTIEIEDRIMREFRRRAIEEKVSLKELVNRALRRDLQNQSMPVNKKKAYRCPTFSMGVPTVPIDKALSLADSMEDEAIASKLEMRK